MTRDVILASLASETPEDSLVAVVQAELSSGTTRESILAELQAARAGLLDADEDVVLDVMDRVSGSCSPHARI